MQYVTARVDPIKLPQASGRPLQNVADEFLRGWQDRGFELRACFAGVSCLKSSPVTAEAAVASLKGGAVLDVLMQPRAPAAPAA